MVYKVLTTHTVTAIEDALLVHGSAGWVLHTFMYNEPFYIAVIYKENT